MEYNIIESELHATNYNYEVTNQAGELLNTLLLPEELTFINILATARLYDEKVYIHKVLETTGLTEKGDMFLAAIQAHDRNNEKYTVNIK